MIKVLQVLGIMSRGGAETMIMNLYRAIDRNAIQFDFIVHTDESGEFDDEIRRLGGKIYHCPKYRGANHFAYKKWWKTFFREHKEYKILHSHIRSTASIYLPIAKKAGLKTVIHSHSTSNGSGFSSMVKRIMQFSIRYKADYFASCSREAGEWLFGKKILNSDRYLFIRNAIDLDLYKTDMDTVNRYKGELNIEGKKVFGHVGRFHEAKNHMFLLDVFKLIHRNDNNTVLVLVGDGELRPQIVSKIQQSGMEDSVLLLGVRSDVPELLSIFDVFLFPSKWEGLPVTVVEAQAAGLPCIISDKITDDVAVTEQVHKLPIESAEKWAELALSDLKKNDVHLKLVNSGFSIKESSNSLTEFYERII